MKVLWQIDLLLSKDVETNKTTAIAMHLYNNRVNVGNSVFCVVHAKEFS
jgi:hypothetical protein